MRKAGCATRAAERRGNSLAVFFLGIFQRDRLFSRMFFIVLREIFASPLLFPSSLSLLESSSVVKSSRPRSFEIVSREFSSYSLKLGKCLQDQKGRLTSCGIEGKSMSVDRYRYYCLVARSIIFCSISQTGQTLLSCSVFLTKLVFLFLKLSRFFLTAYSARMSLANIVLGIYWKSVGNVGIFLAGILQLLLLFISKLANP